MGLGLWGHTRRAGLAGLGRSWYGRDPSEATLTTRGRKWEAGALLLGAEPLKGNTEDSWWSPHALQQGEPHARAPHVRIHQGLLSRPTAQILSLCRKPLGLALQIPPEADISNEKNLQRESGTYTSITTPSPRRSQSSRLLPLRPVLFPGLGLKGMGTDGDVSGSSGRKRGPAGRWVRTD